MLKLLIIAAGGGAGAVARYLVSNWAAARWGGDFPYGTLLVNVTGCFLIGVFMVLVTERIIVNPYWRLLIATGFIGGLTTFSSWGYETWLLVEDAQFTGALYNLAANLLGGFAAAWLGMTLARAI